MNEHLSVEMCTNFQAAIVKNGWVLAFWISKRPLLPYSRGFRHFPDFQILSDLGRSKSVLGSFSVFLMQIWPRSMCHTTKTEILNLTFKISWHLMTLMWQKVSKSLGGFLEVSQTRSMLFNWFYFNLIRLLCPVKRAMIDIIKIWHLARPVTWSVTFR